MARSSEDPLVAKLFDGRQQHDAIARAIEQLTPEEAQYFLLKLEAAYRKRKIQLSGYLVAMVSWLVGMTLALIYFGMNDMSSAWAFLVPFGIVGAILYGFGAWAERVGRGAPASANAQAIEAAVAAVKSTAGAAKPAAGAAKPAADAAEPPAELPGPSGSSAAP